MIVDMQMHLKNDEIVKVTGYLIDDCFWNDGVDDSMYRGCVPWVEIEKIEIVK